MFRRFCAILVSLVAVTRAVAEEWPQFRGPAGNGMSTSKSVPVHWSATEHIVWKQAVPGSGWSSPVLAGGKIYLTTATDLESDAVSLRALCFDAADGRTLWDVEVFKPDPAAVKEHHTKNGVASPTPIVANDRLYVHFGHLGTAALDQIGNKVWPQTELSYQPRHGNGGSPVLVGNLLVFSCDAMEEPFVVALDADTGKVRWKTPRNTAATKKFSFSTPTVIELDGATQVISPGSGFVGAYDPQDGREIWRVRYGEGYSVVPRPVYANGLLFLASGFDRPILLAIDPKGASGDATDKHVPWTITKGAPLTPSVVVVDDALYMVSDNGVATCLDAKTGQQHWTQRLGGNYSASPVVAEGRIYFQSEEGAMHVIKADKIYGSLATNDLGERTLASPAMADGALYLRSESQLWRIGN
jgi:outer membrane protein assembly factor BamB